MPLTGDSPTHAAPRITELTFANALVEGPRVFPSLREIGSIWATMVAHNVDPSFALGMFWMESNFGTAGWAQVSKSQGTPMNAWGNILSANSILLRRGTAGVTTWKPYPEYGYTYARYANWTLGVEDYCLLLQQYVDTSPDARYGDTSKIRGTTAKWPGQPLGSEEHLKYLEVVLQRANMYDSRVPHEGEIMIHTEPAVVSSDQQYLILKGERWYTKPGGNVSYAASADIRPQFYGKVAGTSWVAVRISTARFRTDGKKEIVIAYTPDFKASRLV